MAARIGLNLILSLAAVLLTSCHSKSNSQKTQQPVVKVNSRVLTLKDFSNQVGRKLKDLDSLSAKSEETVLFVKEEIIRSFITRSLILDFAESKKLTVTSNELDNEVKELRSSYPDDVTFRKTLAEESISFSEWQEQLKARLIEKKVFAHINEKIKTPTAEELNRYYTQNKDQFKTKERVYIRQIVVEELSKAEHLKSELKKQSLDKLASKYSISPEGKSGGLVGWISKGDVDLFDPVFSYKVGAPGPVFKSAFGYHIVLVERRSPPSVQSLEEAKPRIIRQILSLKEQALFTEWLDAQLRSSRVSRDNNLINAVRVDTK